MVDNMHVTVNVEVPKEEKTLKAPLVAVDTVVLGVIDKKLSVLLVQIDTGPYKDKWAVPGGLVKMDESLDEAAIRVLTERASLKNIYLEQLYTFGDPKRDTRGRSVSVAYYALVSNSERFDLRKQSYYREMKWFPLKDLPELAFDHSEILKVAHARVKSKLEYTTIAYSLLPKEFTLTQLQKLYEIILGKKLDKRNFRKRITSLDIVESTGKSETDVTHRPAELFRFKKRSLKIF